MATPPSRDEAQAQIASFTPELPPATEGHKQLAARDFREFVALARLTPSRRAAPPWSIPPPVFRMLARPNVYTRSKTEGLGHQPKEHSTETFARHMRAVLLHIRRADTAPIDAHTSFAHNISKDNGKEGCADSRTIHNLWYIFSCFYKAISQRVPKPILPPHQHGFEAHRLVTF